MHVGTLIWELCAQTPRQQSPSVVQGLDGSRQLPGPRSHRPVVSSHTFEQQPAPASAAQASAVGRQLVVVIAHRPVAHLPEQHSLSASQLALAVLQIGPPHCPPVHASAQQSPGSVQGAPLAWQNCVHASDPRGPGSHRPLQQVFRLSHWAPGGAQVPGGRQ
jgi:hypothetical protein